MGRNFKATRAKAPPAAKALADTDASFRAVTDTLNLHNEALEQLNGGIELGKHTTGVIKDLSFAMPAEAPWKAYPHNSTDWAVGVLPAPEILMEPGGNVKLRGFLDANSGGGGGSIAPSAGAATAITGTLATGYRPFRAMSLPGFSSSVPTPALFSINTSGVVRYTAGVSPAQVVGFDGMQWHAATAAPPHQFSGPGWPLVVRHDFTRPCIGLLPMGFRLSDQGAQNVGAGAPVVDWQDLGDGQLRINGVWGLQWGRRYTLRLFLYPEEA